MKVKICGITELPSALYAVEQGADALGFVFARSKREISVNQASQLIDNLPKEVLKVGVFVNESAEGIEEIVKQAGLTHVQLHGDESPAFCRSLSVPVIKAVSIDSKFDLQKIEEYDCEHILLDSPKGKYRGGNGVVFDWSLLSDYDFGDKKVILAGGLNEENVEEAIKTANPYMVDVSSGVERNGRKDLAKIERFVGKVKHTIKEEIQQ